MNKGICNIRIGTSGWHYDQWEGIFYPQGVPRKKWLTYYAQYFNTVEINNTFYQLPKEDTFRHWHAQVPEDFLFTVKANRFITHIKRLRDVKESLVKFYERVLLLKSCLGPILYQLPPSMHQDLERLEGFLKLLPEQPTTVFEFRHKSWFDEDTYRLLEAYNAGFCVHDLHGEVTPKIVTDKTVYVRFHGTTGRYAGSYTQVQLRDWAAWIKQYVQQVSSIYVYFNNDTEGHAVKNAETLKKALS